MNEERIKEIIEFRDSFNKKLEESFKRYEEKIKLEKENQKKKNKQTFKTKSLKKCLTSMNEQMEYKYARKMKRNTISANLFQKNPPWQPTNGYPIYFGDYKRLKDGYQMNDWEKNRIGFAERSYRKEKDLPLKFNFTCRKLYSDYIGPNPNRKQTKDEATKTLTLDGKRMIKAFIERNDKLEEELREKERLVFEYMHSKPPLIINPWKKSNHIIKEFSIPPLDKIYSFKLGIKPKPHYSVKPFKRPKDYPDYFDKHIGIL